MRATRGAVFVAVLALLAAGCHGGSMTKYRFSKDSGSLQSLATEGSVLADGVVDGRITTAFVRTHAQELASDTEKLASVLDSTHPQPGLERKTKRLAALAREAARALRALADHPSDATAAVGVKSALTNAADSAEKLEKSL